MKLIKRCAPDVNRWFATHRPGDLFTELDRFLDNSWGILPVGDRTPRVSAFIPAVDFLENDDNYVVKAELPGLQKQDIAVSLQDDILTISGERKEEKTSKEDSPKYTERYYGRFERTINLPSTVDSEKVKADYADGVLTVTLSKSEAVKPKQIAIAG